MTRDDLRDYLLDKPSIKGYRCAVCGQMATNRHHVVPKGMGGTRYENRIPVITLCGAGNTSGCHGLAHKLMLHFRWKHNQWEYIRTRPMKYIEALGEPGWKPLPGWLEEQKWDKPIGGR